MLVILLLSMMNHSLKTFLRVVVPGFLRNTAIARTTPAYSSTTGYLRAATFCTLIFARLDVQSLAGAGPPLAAAGAPFAAPRPVAPRPVTVFPFSVRLHPGTAMMMDPSWVVIPSK